MLYFIEHKTQSLDRYETICNLTTLPHIHPHLELIYLLEGSAIATADQKSALLEAGDIFLSFPNQIHYYYTQSPIQGIMLIFTSDLVRELEPYFHDQLPDSPVIKKPVLSFDTTALITTIMDKFSSSASIDKTAAIGYLQALLGELLPMMTLVPNTSDQDSIKLVFQYCLEHYTEPLTLEEVSRELHLSKYYISHMFKERMNISFLTFLNGMRVEHACNLLKKGTRITDAAFSSGFSSLRTFNRIFVQSMGITPREYGKTHK